MTQDTEAERAELLHALEESQSLLAAMLHESRPASEIQKQMEQNREAIDAYRRAPAAPAPHNVEQMRSVLIEMHDFVRFVWRCVSRNKSYEPATTQELFELDKKASEVLSPAPQPPEGEGMISSREVVSKHGSGITITRLNLSEAGRVALQSRAISIPDVAKTKDAK